MKYLLPWKERNYGIEDIGSYIVRYQRRELGTNKVRAEIQMHIASGKYVNDVDGIDYASFRQAAEAQDKSLIEDGFYLIKPEEVERFENKLKLLL